MNRRDFSRVLLIPGAATQSLLFSSTVGAQASAPVEGKEFTRMDTPQPTPGTGKVEVLEFFSYACPACNAFEPKLDAWARALPPDVVLRRVPVSFLANAENFQRTYYALETLGLVEKLHGKVFAAVHVDRQTLTKPEDIAALVGRNGADATAFLAAFKSFSVATAVNRAKKMTADYAVPHIPALAVQGRYMTSPGQAGGGAQALSVADVLIQRARKG